MENSWHILSVSQSWAERQGLRVKTFCTVSSTQDIAKKEIFQTDSWLTLYMASFQSEGRGRQSSSQWMAKADSSFLASWLFLHEKSLQIEWSEKLGLAIVSSCQEVWPWEQWSLKAPNDILLRGKKVCGLLIDHFTQGSQSCSIVGMGFNIFDTPPLERAIALGDICQPSSQEWEQFLSHLYKNFSSIFRTSKMVL